MSRKREQKNNQNMEQLAKQLQDEIFYSHYDSWGKDIEEAKQADLVDPNNSASWAGVDYHYKMFRGNQLTPQLSPERLAEIDQMLTDAPELVNATAEGVPLFFSAIMFGGRQVFDVFMKHGVDVDMLDAEHNTALMHIGFNQSLTQSIPLEDHLYMQQRLLDAGAGLSYENNRHETAAMRLCQYGGHDEAIRALMEAMAETYLMQSDITSLLNTQHRNGDTLLHVLIRTGHNALAIEAVELGAKYDLQNDDGRNAPVEACYQANEELVNYFIQKPDAKFYFATKAHQEIFREKGLLEEGLCARAMCRQAELYKEKVVAFDSNQLTLQDFFEIYGYIDEAREVSMPLPTSVGPHKDPAVPYVMHDQKSLVKQ